MSKILLVTLEYPPHCGGVGYYYRSLVEALPKGCIHVLAPRTEKSKIQNPKSKTIFEIPNSEFEIRREFFWSVWPRWGRLVVELVRILRKERYDWIAIGQVLPIGTAVVIARFIARFIYQLPVTSYELLVFTHGMDIATLHGRKRHLARWILNRCELVIANSQFTKRAVEALGIASKKVHVLTPCPAANIGELPVIPPQRDPALAVASYQLQVTAPLILSVGRLVRRKGFDTVLRVYAKLRQQYLTLELKIIGDGPDRARLHALACELDLDPAQIFLGAMEHEQIAPWYDCASVFLLLPRDEGSGDVEGFGMVFLEANAHGVPVVAGRSGGVPDAVIDEETGYLVDPLNVDSAVSRVRALLEDESLRQRLAEQGRARVLQDFRWQDRAQELQALLMSSVIPSRVEGSRDDRVDISVIIPVFNHARELNRCIDSLRHQTLPPTELIIVDDGSTDDSAAVGKQERARGGPWQRCEVITQANAGAPSARNAGFAVSTGSFVLFSDADITWKPHALATLQGALLSRPEISYAYSSFYFGWKLFKSGAFDPESLKRVNYIHTSSLIRRQHFPGFDPALKKFQDWDLWLTMLEQGHTGFWVEEPLFHVAPRRTGMSHWYPSFMYKIPWGRFGIRIPAVEQYRQAAEIIRTKHQL